VVVVKRRNCVAVGRQVYPRRFSAPRRCGCVNDSLVFSALDVVAAVGDKRTGHWSLLWLCCAALAVVAVSRLSQWPAVTVAVVPWL